MRAEIHSETGYYVAASVFLQQGGGGKTEPTDWPQALLYRNQVPSTTPAGDIA